MKKLLILCLTLLFFSFITSAQDTNLTVFDDDPVVPIGPGGPGGPGDPATPIPIISGLTSVKVNDIKTYLLSPAPAINLNQKGIWAVTKGVILSQSNTNIQIKWTASGSGSITYLIVDKQFEELIFKTVSLNVVIGSSTGSSTPNPTPNPTTNLSNENYIYTITPRKATTDVSGLSNDEKIENVTYFDGLGRAKQSIAIRAGGQKQDIVTHIEYDAFGRQAKEYLPFAATTNNGLYRTGDLATTTNHYYKTKYAEDFAGVTVPNTNAYSQKVFDKSPLNRVLEQAAPGKDWKVGAGHTIQFEYATNTATEVRQYYVTTTFSNNTYTPTLQLNTSINSGYYKASQLYKTITKDENHTGTTKNHTTEEFKNKQGQVVLKRTYADIDLNGDGDTADTGEQQAKHDTYYVYDDFGNLTYVLPPKAEANTSKPNSTKLSELCYQYKYDHRNRLVEKKIPGKGWEYIIYDNLDRPVLTQDANQRTPKKWLFTKYDQLGRVIYTGIYTHASLSSRTSMQTTFKNKSEAQNYETKVTSGTGYSGTYYSNSDFPNSNLEILTVNYYDNYTFNRAGAGISVTTNGVTSTSNVKGLATGSRVKILDTNPTKWITTVSYYDAKARSIYTYSKNEYLSSIDIVESKLDFVGKVLETKSHHSKTGDNIASTIIIKDDLTYDHMDRLKKQSQTIGTHTETIVENTYDDLGKLITKGVGGKSSNTNRLQTVNYKYNVRGWLRGINDNNTSNTSVSLASGDLFGFEINYNNPSTGGTALYNGNISQTLWKTTSANPSGNTISNKYSYSYDALNRITSANDNTGRYDVWGIVYDKNGNIKNLKRDGHLNSSYTSFGQMDNLTYSYDSGNKLMKVSDALANDQFGFKDDALNNTADSSNDYSYDANGNMLTDTNKGITSISYNHLNLPKSVTLAGGTITYKYDATGVKQSKVADGKLTEYAGNFIYKKIGTGTKTLEFFNHAEGYASPNGTTGNVWKYVYQYKDHLGNVRLSYSDANKNSSITQSEIIEESNYYPFGLKHKGYNNVVSSNGNSTAQKFGFQGQELQEDLNLNWSSFKWRNADPAIGRFFNIDPLAEDFVHNGTYNFSENRVIDAIELEGLEAVVLNGEVRGGSAVGGYASIQLAADVKGNVALQYSYGAGLFFGAGAGAGVGVSISAAPTVDDLAGAGAEVGLFGGQVISLAGEINFSFTSDGEDWIDAFTAPKNQYIGATISAGPGIGLGVYLNLSNTGTIGKLSSDEIKNFITDTFKGNKEYGNALNGILDITKDFLKSNEGATSFSKEQLQSYYDNISGYMYIINNQNEEEE
ncbi:DUF6443 domain-containing protein [Polaribacter cellanae]|uniref:DUF6443 domain-containing protein n=1 Tax=Polaribacter cellanae TaxID=2818493 RepID=A0A975CT87_9FLAO|nr:DUF6443 domain-containing protein [Polaribacter cellanae]QTE24564.1 hypothetical protein J3359_09865 [Polaribacter cellanae]